MPLTPSIRKSSQEEEKEEEEEEISVILELLADAGAKSKIWPTTPPPPLKI